MGVIEVLLTAAAALLNTMFNELCHFSSCMNEQPLSPILLALLVHRASFQPTTNTVSEQ